jgi:hypothetical protein
MDFDSEKALHFGQIDEPVGQSLSLCALPVVVQQICQFICFFMYIYNLFF